MSGGSRGCVQRSSAEYPCMPRSQRPPSRRHGVRLVGVRGMAARSCCLHLSLEIRGDMWRYGAAVVIYARRSEHSRSARSTSTTGRKNSFLLIVMRSRAEPDESRWSPSRAWLREKVPRRFRAGSEQASVPASCTGWTDSEHWPEARLVSASLGPTVSEHWSELAQRITVAYGVKSGPRLRKEGRTMPVTWLRRGTISSRIARSLPTGRTRVGS